MIKSLEGFGWNNVGLASQTVAQHGISIGPMYRVIWVEAYLATVVEKRHPHRNAPANSRQSPIAVSMLGQHQRLWVNIETASGECHVFADVLAQSIQQTQCWITVGKAS